MKTIWQTKIEAIMKLGKSQASIARFCETSDSTILHLRTGNTTDPLYSTGKKIDDLMKTLGLNKAE